MTLILHCGGKPVSFEELGAIDLPQETDTYKPVAHTDMVRLAADRVRKELNYDGEMEWSHGVNRDGAQYFGLLRMVDLKVTDQHCLSMGLRNSLDKSLSGGCCLGPNCLVCDNLSFGASLVTILRKHTKHIFRDLKRLFNEALEVAVENATLHAQVIESWETVTLDKEEGYRILGTMTGRGILPARISGYAYGHWQKDDTYRNRTKFGLYGAVTEAVKQVTPGRVFKTYTGVHEFFVDDVVAA